MDLLAPPITKSGTLDRRSPPAPECRSGLQAAANHARLNFPSAAGRESVGCRSQRQRGRMLTEREESWGGSYTVSAPTKETPASLTPSARGFLLVLRGLSQARPLAPCLPRRPVPSRAGVEHQRAADGNRSSTLGRLSRVARRRIGRVIQPPQRAGPGTQRFDTAAGDGFRGVREVDRYLDRPSEEGAGRVAAPRAHQRVLAQAASRPVTSSSRAAK
jgi:hypothetical protein